MTPMQDVRTYLMGCANTYVDQSVSSCMANQGAHEVAAFNLLHVHMYNMRSTCMYVCAHIMCVRLARLRCKLVLPSYTSVAMTTPMGPQCEDEASPKY